MLVNAYVLDPAHISPSRSDAASNGHFPFPPGHVPAGTPRGFNFSNMPFGFGPGGSMPGGGPFQGMPSGAGLPGFVNAGNWAGGMAVANGGAAGLHNPGVIRRGGRNYNRSGPYDRRNGRFGGPGGPASGNGGRLSPVRGMFGAPNAGGAYIPAGHPAALAAGMAGFGPGGGRWGDNAGGGPQAMGPREAVQGRSIKSYEDLDAVGGAGNGELNY